MFTLPVRSHRASLPALRFLALLLATLAALSLGGCGSTKVYTAQKTVIYKGTLYNLSNVQRIAPSIEATLPDGSKVDMRTLDNKKAEQLFKDNANVRVNMTIQLDQDNLVYMNGPVGKYSDYKNAAKRFDSALNKINKFMADKKKTQLKLK